MVISTSTPGSMTMEVMCFTASEGECRSMMRCVVWGVWREGLWFDVRVWVWGGGMKVEKRGVGVWVWMWV
jgi:hypothetical protein